VTAKGLILSSSIVEVFLENRPTLERGEIVLLLSPPKSRGAKILSQEYKDDVLSFTFDISELRPMYVTFYDLTIELRDINGNIIGEAKLKKSVGKIDSMITGITKKVIQDFIIVAKNINGSKVFIFKKMNTGEKCKECWDYDLDSSMNSNCPVCGGTGMSTRYSQSYVTYAGAIQASSLSRENTQEGMTSNYGPSQLSLPSMIELETDDVLFYQIRGMWFIVNSNITISALKNIDTLQTVAISELPSHSPQIETLSKDREWKLTNKWR
jgi:hypothetical protein